MKTNPLQFRPEFTRRDALKGLTLGAGATLLSPFLAQLVAHAAGSPAAIRRRVVIVMQSNGLRPSFITPVGRKWKDDGKGGSSAREVLEVPLAGQQLPAALEPLTPFRQSRRARLLLRQQGARPDD